VRVRWTSQSLGDIARLHAFLAGVNRSAAAKIVRSFTLAARQLREHPRSGEVLEEFAPREVRRLIVGAYVDISSLCPFRPKLMSNRV